MLSDDARGWNTKCFGQADIDVLIRRPCEGIPLHSRPWNRVGRCKRRGVWCGRIGWRGEIVLASGAGWEVDVVVVGVARGRPGLERCRAGVNPSTSIGCRADAGIWAVLVIKMSRWAADLAVRCHRVRRCPREAAMVLIRAAQGPSISDGVQPALREEPRLVQSKDADIVPEVIVRATIGIVDADGGIWI